MSKNTLELSNGDTIYLKPFATRGLMKEIQSKMLEGQKVNVQSSGKMEFDASKLTEIEDFTVIRMIDKIIKSDAINVEVNISYLDNLRNSDYQLIKTEVDKRTKSTELGKE